MRVVAAGLPNESDGSESALVESRHMKFDKSAWRRGCVGLRPDSLEFIRPALNTRWRRFHSRSIKLRLA
eukprot:6207302-Pleurochrysis_carterae.AAC.2